MTTFEEARAAVQERLDQLATRSRIELVMPDEWVTDEGWCWVFGFNSRAYFESRRAGDSVVGPGPFMVEKQTGVVHQLLSARPVEEQLDEIRRGTADNS